MGGSALGVGNAFVGAGMAVAAGADGVTDIGPAVLAAVGVTFLSPPVAFVVFDSCPLQAKARIVNRVPLIMMVLKIFRLPPAFVGKSDFR